MTRIEERRFKAQPAGIGEAVAFVEACCAQGGVARDDALRLALITEELFTNTVVHGHGGGADAVVHIVLRIEAAEILLDYSDEAAPFDPLARLPDALAPLEAQPDARRPGGLGVPLVVQLASRIRYSRVGDRNCLSIALTRAGERLQD